MAIILNLETSTQVCSAAIAKDGKVLAYRENQEDKSHATLLTVFVEELIDELQIKISDLDAVSVSEGPGSYTGLRIGASVAKGLCYGAGIPLIAVDTLKAMAMMAKDAYKSEVDYFLPMIDARRMEVYSKVFSAELSEKQPTKAEIITEESYADLLVDKKLLFIGNGADKCTETIQHENAIFLTDIYPSAKYMAPLAEEAFTNGSFKDVAYFEPFYLKDFVATVSKKKMF